MRGANVVLVAGPVSLPTPDRHHPHRRPLRRDRCTRRCSAQLPADVYIGAAAVADFAPAQAATNKIKKNRGAGHAHPGRWCVRATSWPTSPRTRSGRGLVVGFAAETDHVEAYARGKLESKRLDMIAANRVGVAGSGFESDDNALAVYCRRRRIAGARARRPSGSSPTNCWT